MKKQELQNKLDAVKTETKNALQLVFNQLNQGQQKKLLKEEAIAELFERYGVEY